VTKAPLRASPRNCIDIGQVAVLGGRSKSEAGKALRADEKTAVSDVDVYAAIKMAIKEPADSDGSSSAGLEIAYQEIGGLPGGENSFAEENVLAFYVDLRGIKDFLGCDLVIEKLASVGLHELAADVAGDFTDQVGNEEETIFENADTMQDPARVVARYLSPQRSDALMQALLRDDEFTISSVLLNHPVSRPLHCTFQVERLHHPPEPRQRGLRRAILEPKQCALQPELRANADGARPE